MAADASSTASAAAAKKAAAAAAKRLRQLTNERTAGYFGGAFAGLVLLFVIFHWSRYFASKHANKDTALTRKVTSLTRYVFLHSDETLSVLICGIA